MAQPLPVMPLLLSPKLMHPKQIRETSAPVLPNLVYSIKSSSLPRPAALFYRIISGLLILFDAASFNPI